MYLLLGGAKRYYAKWKRKLAVRYEIGASHSSLA
jgi:hypothetical protein